MKKIVFTLAILALAASCAKEATAPGNGSNAGKKELVKMTFTVSSGESAQTAAYLNSDRSVSFRENDKISIFSNGTNYEFTTTAGGNVATFSGEAELSDTYYAVYPYTAAATISGNVISNLTLSAGSEGTGTGNFNSKKVVMVAVTSGDHIHFRHLCALFKVTVPEALNDADHGLTEIIAFNRDQVASGALTGTFNVTVSENAAPTFTATTAKWQSGLSGPNGSSKIIPPGDYYIPVLPATLTNKKGIDLKLTFKDGFVGRAFNGKGMQLQPGQVYNLGTIVKTDEYVDSGFESADPLVYFYSDNKASDGSSALSVIANPHPTTTNNSAHVLSDDMSPKTNNTSGYFEVRTGQNEAYVKFPSGVRNNYDKIRFKIWLGNNAYYPRIKRGSEPATWAAKINGVDVTGADDEAKKEVWDANVKSDDWNILEFTASGLTSTWTNFTNLATWQIRPFVDYQGNNTTGYDADTNNRTVYIGDITYVLK